jgi:hypothetical protein
LRRPHDIHVREFERQVENLVARNYPELAGMSAAAFTETFAPLGRRLAEIRTMSNGSSLPFVIVVKHDLVSTQRAMSKVEFGRQRGIVRMDPTEPEEFDAIDGLDVPAEPAYLAVGLDTGQGTLNVTPEEALETIVGAGRSPLTIDEGVALATHFPEVLRERNAFSILGSRRGDRRVPALWISGGAPRLGWCWAGNPHSWLGSASCAARLGT